MQIIYKFFPFMVSWLRIRHTYCIAAAIWMHACGVMASEWPKLVIPDHAKVVIVADRIDINRRPMRIWQFHSNRPSEQILEFYRRKWTKPPKEGVPAYIENSTEDWKIISRAEDGFIIAVQIDAKNKLVSDGMVSIAQINGQLVDRAQVTRLPEYPKMPGSKILQELTNYDPGKNALTVIVENGHSAASNRAYHKKFYESRGWVEIGLNHKGGRGADVLLLQKGPLETSFTFVTKSAKTQVVGSIQYLENSP